MSSRPTFAPSAFSRVQGEFPLTISWSSSDAQSFIMKGILFFAALPPKMLLVPDTICQPYPCCNPIFAALPALLCVQGSLHLWFPFPQSWESINPEPS